MSENIINTMYQYTFNRIDKNLTWVHFINSPWVRETGGGHIEAFVIFLHPTRRFENLELITPEQRTLSTFTESIEILPERFAKFNDKPDHFKSFFKISFSIDKPEVIIGRALINGKLIQLFTLIPKIIYPNFLFDILNQGQLYFEGAEFENFVETGTLFAHTAIHASYIFKQVYSIELNKELFGNAKKLESDFQNLSFINGDSGLEIFSVLNKLDGPSVFFLDAHWSGDATVNWKDSKFKGFQVNTSHLGKIINKTPSSEEQVPLDKELKIILEKFPHEAIIIIDDWQSIGNKNHTFIGEDWSHLSQEDLIRQFEKISRVRFQYPFDQKHYVVGLSAL